jgi:biotin carboxyl carrier protein
MEEAKEIQSNIKKVSYKSLLIENIKYRTLLTKKYTEKKPYVRQDIKKITAFIPGTIKKIYIKKGKRVKEGEKLLILEAMKMKNDILSPFNGTIKEVYVKEGQRVTKNELLIEFK